MFEDFILTRATVWLGHRSTFLFVYIRHGHIKVISKSSKMSVKSWVLFCPCMNKIHQWMNNLWRFITIKANWRSRSCQNHPTFWLGHKCCFVYVWIISIHKWKSYMIIKAKLKEIWTKYDLVGQRSYKGQGHIKITQHVALVISVGLSI